MKSIKCFFGACVIISLGSSCNSSLHNDYSQELKGTWGINDFEHLDFTENNEVDLRQEGYFTIGLEHNNHLWFSKRENRSTRHIRATYEIFKKNDTLKLLIEKSDDVRIEGVYDLYIDTIEKGELQNKIQLSLDSENTYLRALRWKNK